MNYYFMSENLERPESDYYEEPETLLVRKNMDPEIARALGHIQDANRSVRPEDDNKESSVDPLGPHHAA